MSVIRRIPSHIDEETDEGLNPGTVVTIGEGSIVK